MSKKLPNAVLKLSIIFSFGKSKNCISRYHNMPISEVFLLHIKIPKCLNRLLFFKDVKGINTAINRYQFPFAFSKGVNRTLRPHMPY